MSRKIDLEQHIRASYALIREYEAIIQTSSDPREKARARRVIEEQRALIAGYLAEYRSLAGDALPADVAEIAARFSAEREPPPVTTPPAAPSAALGGGTSYTINIEHAEGIAIGDGARVERTKPATAASLPVPPGVAVSLLTHTVPTAFCHHLDATSFPLVTATLDNTGQGCANAALRISAAIESYSDTVTTSPQVAQGELTRVPLLPLLQPAAVATLNEIRPATLRVTVEQTAPMERTLYDRTERIHLLARDVALLAVQAADGSIVDLSDYLAAWVTPRRPEIERLLRRAAEYHPDRRLAGYQGASTEPEAAEVVRRQAQAIFVALKQNAGLTYVESSLSLGAEGGQITQRVRLPTESLAAGGSANCLDGTVLFASLLELASLDPFIVVVPGHAFAGWRIWPDVDRYEFLETTMIGSDDFEDAQQAARAQYDKVLAHGYLTRGLFDPGGFARLIDVAACRKKGIHPLE